MRAIDLSLRPLLSFGESMYVYGKRTASTFVVSGMTTIVLATTGLRTIAGLKPCCSCPPTFGISTKTISPFFIYFLAFYLLTRTLGHLVRPMRRVHF